MVSTIQYGGRQTLIIKHQIDICLKKKENKKNMISDEVWIEFGVYKEVGMRVWQSDAMWGRFRAFCLPITHMRRQEPPSGNRILFSLGGAMDPHGTDDPC